MNIPWAEALVYFSLLLGFVLALLLLTRILREPRTPSATIAWLLIIVLLPYAGVPLYLMLGGRKLPRLARKKPPIHLSAKTPAREPVFAEMEGLLRGYGLPPANKGNALRIHRTGTESYAALVDLIERAQHSIHLAIFILHPDDTGLDVLSRLARRAAQGVQVRILLDGVGSMSTHRWHLSKLKKAGARWAFFNSVFRHPLRGSSNLRNHRKLVIADGRHVLAGGANIAADYMGPDSDDGHWQDLTFTLTGPAVASFIELFHSDWQFAAGESLPAPAAGDVPAVAGAAEVQVIPSGPDVGGDPLYEALLSAAYWSRHRLWLVTPYFIPDTALHRALMSAALRGVDVVVLLPRRSNHRLADLAGRSYVREFEDCGGRVLFFERGMLHAKSVLMDDHLAMLGSANIDMRSLLLNYECALFIYSRPDVATIEGWMRELMQHTVTGIEMAGALRRTLEGMARLLGPQL